MLVHKCPCQKQKDTISLEDILKAFPEEEDAQLKRIDEIYMSLNRLSAGELLAIDETSNGEMVKTIFTNL